MEKPSTLKKSVKQNKISENPTSLNNVESTSKEHVSEPSSSSIDLLLNYSKSLSVKTSKEIGAIFTVLN